MKNKHIFYIVCCFAALVICTVGIRYATDTLTSTSRMLQPFHRPL
ncbi:MAG: hypothetical protein OYL97_01400 [Candidatus Poribacteria bacterium]|nr:hypothetical protein [Candidatus Poribacteria bacterium]